MISPLLFSEDEKDDERELGPHPRSSRSSSDYRNDSPAAVASRSRSLSTGDIFSLQIRPTSSRVEYRARSSLVGRNFCVDMSLSGSVVVSEELFNKVDNVDEADNPETCLIKDMDSEMNERTKQLETVNETKKIDTNMRASWFIFLSALAASLMSLDVKEFNRWAGGDGMFVALCTGIIGFVVSFALFLFNATSTSFDFLLNRSKCMWLAIRSILGGLSCLLAFGGFARLDLAVANTLMFSMPLWTALLSYVVTGRAWDAMDLVMAIFCMGGVLLVSTFWDVRALGDGQGDDQLGGKGGLTSGLVGLGCALGFALTNAVAAVVINTRCRGESPLLMTSLSMLVTALIAGAVFTHRYLEQNEQHEDFFLDDPSWFKLACLALLGILMVSQQGLRNYGLSIASDSSVTVVLYAEVAFSFAFDLAVLGARPSPLQFLGAALIVIGSVLAVVLRVLARRKLENRAQVEKKGVLLPQRIGEQ